MRLVLLAVTAASLAGCDSDAIATQNRPPEIEDVSVSFGDPQNLWCWRAARLDAVATDPDGDTVSYKWSSVYGTESVSVINSGETLMVCLNEREFRIRLIVSDGKKTAEWEETLSVPDSVPSW